MELSENQAALILEAGEDGEISVDVAASDINSLASAICQAIATKLMGDEEFQEEIMDMLSDEE